MRREELRAKKCTLSVDSGQDMRGEEGTGKDTTQPDRTFTHLVPVRFRMKCFQSESLDLSVVNELSQR